MGAGMVTQRRHDVGRSVVRVPVQRLVEAFEAHRSAVRATMSGGLGQLTALADDPDDASPTLLEGSVQVLHPGPSPRLGDPER